MAPLSQHRQTRNPAGRGSLGRNATCFALIATAAIFIFISAAPAMQSQSGQTQTQSQPPANPQPAQDIPDAPSTVQPPVPKPAFPPPDAVGADQGAAGQPGSGQPGPGQPEEGKPAPPPMSPIETVPAGSTPRNQINPKETLYTIPVSARFVQVPVTVKDPDGRRVDGLLPKDFTVLENGKKQTLTYFSSDPFELSVAVLLDIGMPDVAVQKMNQSYSALIGAFSPYDEVAIYTYSSTVSQVTDYTGRPERLTAALNQMKLVRGDSGGPPVLGGPFSGGPTVNGAPVGGGGVAPVNTPDRESHVLNDAILRAAQDLSKRERTRRKVIIVISDGREFGSQAGYRDVLKVLETRGIQVKAVVVDSGALPVFKQVERFHIKTQGYSDILPKYTSATGGGQVLTELSRNSMEEAYAQITSEARNQYTLGYVPPAAATSGRREIEVLVDRPQLKIFAKDAYYATPSAHAAPAPAAGSPE
jgi:VWFA-related protein